MTLAAPPPGAGGVPGAVRARNWGFRHPGRATWAVTGIDLDLQPGSLNVLLGRSGAGKSTLLAGLAGVLSEGESTGTLQVGGLIGLVSQDPSGNIVMERVGDDVAFALENHAVPTHQIWPRVRQALSLVGLEVPLDRRTTELSGGQLQLLALAAALALRPQVLLLDEPTANLDPSSAARIVAAVERARATLGCTVVLIEHRVDPWLARADSVLILRPPEPGLAVISPAALLPLVGAAPDLRQEIWVREPAADRRDLAGRRADGAEPVLVACAVAAGERLPTPVSLEIRPGEIVGLTGPPGSGKSTLLQCLTGLLTPTAGTVDLITNGGRQNVQGLPPSQLPRHFGVVFQNPEHSFLTGNVADELAYSLRAAKVAPAETADRVAAMINRLDLRGLAEVNPFTLSGGQQRRLSVGTALIRDPGILVLDEPTFGQDPRSWAALVQVMRGHSEAGGSVLLATHDPHLLPALGAREVTLRPSEPVAPAPANAAPERSRRNLASVNALVLLGCALALSVAGLLARTPASALALAAFSLISGFVWGPTRKRLAVLLIPVAVAALSVTLSNAMLAPGGLGVSANWQAAALPGSRVFAVASPGLVAAVALDPTALADSLTTWARVPARAAYSVLAGLRLLPLLFAEVGILRAASRARGTVGNRLHAFGSLAFRLLVAALRRGARLAVALDARGLRAGVRRTVARPPVLTGWDALAVGSSLAFTMIALR